MADFLPKLLRDAAPELERILTAMSGARNLLKKSAPIHRETVWVAMRDGVRLATDVYLPTNGPAPTIAVRTPYGRAHEKLGPALQVLAQHGYAAVSQDCRGTGDSEPDTWDYYVFERDDSFDLVEWIASQAWFDGFLGGSGGSYMAQTQWCMAAHPRMGAIAPEVGGLGVAVNTTRLYMFLNAYSRSVGKGSEKVQVAHDELERAMLQETLSGGYFNEPLTESFSPSLIKRYQQLQSLSVREGQRWLWKQYSSLSGAGRAALIRDAVQEPAVTAAGIEQAQRFFGHEISHDAHTLPCASQSELCRSIRSPALMITGWYDWGLNDALATWELLMREADETVASRCRLVIAPSAHSSPGYHEQAQGRLELERTYRIQDIVELLLFWYDGQRKNTTDTWPKVTYYLMGENQWCTASAWPPPEARVVSLYLSAGGTLSLTRPSQASPPDSYTYLPDDPTPTVGGSIVSNVYHAGSVDVSDVQRRPDVLTYTTDILSRDLDVIGSLKLILHVSSTAPDTDFSARLSDVFPDGRAVQMQSGIIRARYRNLSGEPELLVPGQVYALSIDMWATAVRFKAGHRVRVDICSADFPRFDRNANRGGEPGAPVAAIQSIYRDLQHPSHLLVSVLGSPPLFKDQGRLS